MTANVSIRTAQRQPLVLPAAAIRGDGHENFVYVEANGAAIKRVVLIGAREGSFVEIKRGLSPEDRVLQGEIAVPK